MGVARYELSSKMAAQPPPYGASAPHQQGYAPPPQQGFAPPPQQGYAPPPQQAQQPVVVQVQHGTSAPIVSGQINFNQHPVTMTCPHCQANITTSTTTSNGGCVWLLGLSIFILSSGTCCPCAFIPCCVDDLKDVTHSCPSCNRVVGTYKKLKI